MNLTRVVWSEDIPVLITKDFTEVKRFFKNLKKPPHDYERDTWDLITAIYLFAYDDRYDVDREMSGDVIVIDKDTNEIVEQEHWSDRVP